MRMQREQSGLISINGHALVTTSDIERSSMLRSEISVRMVRAAHRSGAIRGLIHLLRHMARQAISSEAVCCEKKKPAHPCGCAGLLWLEERLRGH